jgi:lysophospholipase L1-like esterase
MNRINRSRLFVFYGLLIMLVAVAFELMGWAIITYRFPDYEIARRIMLGERDIHLVRGHMAIGQAYLLYIPAPLYTDGKGIVQHNEDGYRGPRVPLERTPGVARILFLGGSTTYGVMVDDPNQSYPAHVGALLKQNLPDGIRDVEVINAGMGWATTAELLTYYLFKFRYYRPDLVVINTGGNDAMANIYPYYHPDYSHWRHPMLNLQPLESRGRWLLYSRLISFVALNLFFNDLIYDGGWLVHSARPTVSWYDRIRDPEAQADTGPLVSATEYGDRVPSWYEGAQYDPQEKQPIPDEDLAFTNNLRTLIREIQQDGVNVLLVPFRANPNPNPMNYYTEKTLRQMFRHEHIIYELGQRLEVAIAPFPAAAISEKNWLDSCHLNGEGNREKAEHLIPYIRPMLDRAIR